MTSKKEKTLEILAEKFISLDPELKDKITWYIIGRQEEKAKWEKKRIA